jgi:lipid-A-disaccharide synthase
MPARKQGGAGQEKMSTTIFISAGEASGEQYGALLIEALKKQLAASGQTAGFFGMGGERMATAGLERVVRSEDMAVMGLTEVVLHLPRIYGEFRKLKKAIRTRRPSVAVLIDFPEIHIRLAREFHRLGIPVIYFVSPQLWAWKKHRIKLVEKFVRRMLVIFPFEEPFYREHGVQAEFVGHPLAELPPPTISREEFAKTSGLDPTKTWIALLPGSRPKEIRHNLPDMLEAAWSLCGYPRNPADRGSEAYASRFLNPVAQMPNRRRLIDQFEFVVPLAPTLNEAQQTAVLDLVDDRGGGLPIRVVDDARATLFHARASVVASGTATVEAALIGNPFVVVYRVSPLTYAIAKRMVKVDHVAMVNLIAGKRIVPELIQHDFTVSNVVRQIELLLPDGPPRESMMKELAQIRGKLNSRPAGQGGITSAIERVAAIILEELRPASPVQNK